MSPSKIIAIDFFLGNVGTLPDGVWGIGVWVQMQFIACWLKICESLHYPHVCAACKDRFFSSQTCPYTGNAYCRRTQLRDRFKIRKDPNGLFCLVHCNSVVFGVHVMDGIYLAQPDFYCVCFPLHILDESSSCFPHVLLRKALIKSPQVGGSWCLGLRDAPIRKRSWPFTPLLLFLMIPSLTFWGDLSRPLTPVRRGKA